MIHNIKLENRLAAIQMDWDHLFCRVHDPALFDGLDRESAVRWYSYLFTIPKYQSGHPCLRTHVLALYDPFAKRSVFPAGLRFSCNVYVGCSHNCSYCYTQTYGRDPNEAARSKLEFRERLEQDLWELKALELPSVPLHISNSTDPLQNQLESKHRDMRYLLLRLVEGERNHFSLIRILTRNPLPLTEPDYGSLLRELGQQVTVQISLPILNEDAGQMYESGVPSAQSRLHALSCLRAMDIPVSLRIDPLFPRDPLPTDIFGDSRLCHYGIPPAQSEEDLRYLVQVAADNGCVSIIFSGLKIPRGRYVREKSFLRLFEPLYRDAAKRSPARLSGNYLRLPDAYQNQELIRPLLEESKRRGIKLEHCKHNLIHAR
ncbi:MAG: hypothetical protein C4527_21940 [Candidatus Omnitrophota bacterium]|jgi:DNA repair photolyase|nr:MAG: hypothetical protein C4527_21940 [Candidatus Omnitrophota bacterium]